MIPTVPIDLALNLAAGGGIALAARRTLQHPRGAVRTPLLALLMFEGLVFLPVGAYLLWRYPDWSVMYLATVSELPDPPALLALSYPMAALLGFLACRRLLLLGRVGGAVVVVVAALLLAGIIGGLGWRPLLNVGTTEAYRVGAASLASVFETPLMWVLLVVGTAVCVTFGATVWQLVAFGRALRGEVKS